MTLPENIDASYLDQSPGDATHQQHHDEIHGKVNRIPDDGQAVLTSAHEGAADPHPGYLTPAEGNAAYEALVSRTGATAGEVPTLQGDGTLAFASGATAAEGFRAYRSTNQTLSGATFTTIVFDTEVRDDGADYNPATGEWTVPETGWYLVGGAVQFSAVADSERAMTNIYVNAVEHSRLADVESGGAGELNVGGSVPMYLTAADVVTLRGWRGAAGDVTGASSRTYFAAVKV